MSWQNAEELVVKAKADLACRLGVELTAVELDSITPAQWADTSLGLPEPGKLYASVITPGHLIVLRCNGRHYEYRTDGRHVRFRSK